MELKHRGPGKATVSERASPAGSEEGAAPTTLSSYPMAGVAATMTRVLCAGALATVGGCIWADGLACQ